MDSLTQFALGAAVGAATLGPGRAARRGALWGGLCGTLPDLDVFIDRGDPIRDMILHRTESHAIFYLTLASVPIAALIALIHRDRRVLRWWVAVWLALVTHPLLDLMTVYGTQLGLPFTRTPYFVGSVFVIDPVVTVALLVGLAPVFVGMRTAFRWNTVGLSIAVGYLALGVAIQAQIRAVAETALARLGVQPTALLVTPTPFNVVLWRIVAMTPDTWYEGSRSLLDRGEITFVARPTGRPLLERHAGNEHIGRVAWFSHGFVDAAATPEGLRLRDLRMGFGDNYTFTFFLPRVLDRTAPGGDATAAPATGAPATEPATAPAAGAPAPGGSPASTPAVDVVRSPRLLELRAGLPWLWHRILGAPSPFPTGTGPTAE